MKPFRFDSLPTLQTERLILRPITMQDAPAIFAYAKNPEVSKFLSWYPSTSIDETKVIIQGWLDNYKNNKQTPWGIVDKQSGTVIGTFDVRNYNPGKHTAEIGYCLSQDYWGKGLMVEAALAVIDYLFKNTDITELSAFVRIDNLQSHRVLEKLGMHKDPDGRIKKFTPKEQWIELDRLVLKKNNRLCEQKQI